LAEVRMSNTPACLIEGWDFSGYLSKMTFLKIGRLKILVKWTCRIMIKSGNDVL
jgi:hypothetical protein